MRENMNYDELHSTYFDSGLKIRAICDDLEYPAEFAQVFLYIHIRGPEHYKDQAKMESMANIMAEYYNPENQETRDSLFRTRPGSVVRVGDWKLHQYFEDGGLELYNLKQDIGEEHDLAEENPAKVNELLEILDEWRAMTGAPVPAEINENFVPGE